MVMVPWVRMGGHHPIIGFGARCFCMPRRHVDDITSAYFSNLGHLMIAHRSGYAQCRL